MRLTRWQRPEVTVWNPFVSLFSLRDEIERVFDSPVSTPAESARPFVNEWVPAVDVYQGKDDLTIKAELPGMKKEDIDISIQDGVLTLSGERKSDQKQEGTEVCRRERFLGRFQRTFALPNAVDAGKVTAAYKDGVLTLLLPKAEEAKPRQIEIHA